MPGIVSYSSSRKSPTKSDSCPSLAKLKNQQRSGLWDHCFRPLYLVYPVLDALGVKSPTGRYGNVLLAIDFKGRGNTDHAGGCREAPKLIPRACIERPELPVRGSACEYDVSACHQERRPKNGTAEASRSLKATPPLPPHNFR